MESIILENVRSFRGSHEASLAPLTFLVGENSSGKSTLLALARVAWDVAFSHSIPEFNEDPFMLGSYNDIAHYHGGRGKRATSFSVGLTKRQRGRKISSADLVGSFESAAGQPALAKIKISGGGMSISASKDGSKMRFVICAPGKQQEISVERDPSFEFMNGRRLLFMFQDLLYAEVVEGRVPVLMGFTDNPIHLNLTREEAKNLGDLIAVLRRPSPMARPIATAPVRTRPRRTYDPLKEIRSAEGDHVPMLLARLSAAEPETWRNLAEELSSFGRYSGLFDLVQVKRWHKGDESSPFQIKVKMANQRREENLVDVGYGVSQVLPILVDSLVARPGTQFLMQQPEVHLHPRAQAQLGTFLARMATQKKRFLVETHSDYLIDRVRMLVRRGELRPARVKLLYFDNSEGQTSMYPIKLDGEGNLVKPPDGYRQFFLDEELAFLTE